MNFRRGFVALILAVIAAAMMIPGTVVATSGAIIPAHVSGTVPPNEGPPNEAPVVTNDLLPDNNDVTNCVGTVESANCGSKARADGHTYLVFAVLIAGLTFIGWRISRSVRARDEVHKPVG